jgi:DNA-binding MarR family transcriptional regulator
MERVYAFIKAYIADKDIPPSIEDIATGVYLSRGGVLRHLDRLEGMGRLSREPGIPRSIRLLGKSDE